jgi:hypothetical protein
MTVQERWDQLYALRKAGCPPEEMSAATGISVATLYRCGWIDKRAEDAHLH